MNNVHDGVTAAGAQVVGAEGLGDLAGGRLGERGDVTSRKIGHVDEVPDRGAVLRVVVGAEHLERRQLTRHALGHDGHQVVGDALGILAQQARRIAADGVEVPQGNQVPGRIGRGQVSKDRLAHPLGAAVRVGDADTARLGGLFLAVVTGVRHVLMHAEFLPKGTRRARGDDAVHGRGRAEDESLDAIILEHGAEVDEAADVVGVVTQRVPDALGDSLVRGEVDDTGDLGRRIRRGGGRSLCGGVRPGVQVKDGLETGAAAIVDVVEAQQRHAVSRVGIVPGGQHSDAVEDDGVRIAEVVDDDDIVPSLQQLEGRVGANIAQATGDEDVLAVKLRFVELGRRRGGHLRRRGVGAGQGGLGRARGRPRRD